jgi:polyisoprenyl-phosphate glycosyltransferase
MKISIVIPVYNGARSIERLVGELFEKIGVHELEVVLVNDGSRDESDAVCEKIAGRNPRVKYICLRRNFGEHQAVMCGLNFVSGDAAVIIDDDFQNPPGEILKLVRELEGGFDVVYSRYAVKRHHWFRNLGSWFNDRVATVLLKKPSSLYLSSFKAISIGVVREIIKYRGPFPYVDGLILRVTRNISSVLVEHSAREEGRSNYTLKKLISLWLNMFLNFSIVPLRVFTVMGLLLFGIGFMLVIGTVIEKIISPGLPLGYASLFVALMLFSGVQMLFLGLIGEYLGKQYFDQNGTPQWVIRKTVGFKE